MNTRLPMIPDLDSRSGSSTSEHGVGLGNSGGRVKKLNVWLKPRRQGVFPEQEQPPPPGVPGDYAREEMTFTFAQKVEFSSSDEEFTFYYSTPVLGQNRSATSYEDRPALPTLMAHNLASRSNARLPPSIALKPRAVPPRFPFPRAA